MPKKTSKKSSSSSEKETINNNNNTETPSGDVSASSGTTLGKRKTGLLITKPIIYGNYSISQPKKNSEYDWCKWICYVRGLSFDDDLSFIHKVEFHLHETFDNPIRTITKPPFELEEIGWGEFSIRIMIYFHPSSGEEPVELLHNLKLPPSASSSNNKKKKPLITEHYEEILFWEPNEKFENVLLKHSEKLKKICLKKDLKSEDESVRLSICSAIEQYAPIMKEEVCYNSILEGVEKVKEQINDLEKQLEKLKE
ncbi:hypothetical protein ABK040_011470 [Willaertia magna]